MLDLSDGYRSMLALAADLLRRLDEAYEQPSDWLDDEGRITAEGVVLIDELDAHLHPTWQREIGFWLQEHFPRLQFIVATHSPFVTQAAEEGGLFVLQREGNSVQVSTDPPSVRGWRAEQILTFLFNLSSTRAPEVEQALQRQAALEARMAAGQQLTLEEAQELQEVSEELRRYLPPPGDTSREMDHYRQIQGRIADLLRDLTEDPQ
jgi:predicted ATP-binding protein involved in virulence